MKWVTFLARLNRYSAWVAIVTVVLYVITGYGMTKRIMDPDLARYLHLGILPIPLFLALVVHGGISIRHALWRWHVFEKRRNADIFVWIVVLTFLALFMWMFWR